MAYRRIPGRKPGQKLNAPATGRMGTLCFSMERVIYRRACARCTNQDGMTTDLN